MRKRKGLVTRFVQAQDRMKAVTKLQKISIRRNIKMKKISIEKNNIMNKISK